MWVGHTLFWTPYLGDFVFRHRRPLFLPFLCIFNNLVEWVFLGFFTHQLGNVFCFTRQVGEAIFLTHQGGKFLFFFKKLPCPLLDIKAKPYTVSQVGLYDRVNKMFANEYILLLFLANG